MRRNPREVALFSAEMSGCRRGLHFIRLSAVHNVKKQNLTRSSCQGDFCGFPHLEVLHSLEKKEAISDENG
jgi:hypothetical protein